MMRFFLLALVAADFFSDVVAPSAPQGDYCGTCTNLAEQVIGQVLNIILQGGVVGGCKKVCGALPKEDEQYACELVCTVLGVKAFAAAIQKADLDPIYFCELATACTPGPDDA